MIKNLSTIIVKICPDGRIGLSPNDHLKIAQAMVAGYDLIVSKSVQAFLEKNWTEAHRRVVEPWSNTLAWTVFNQAD